MPERDHRRSSGEVRWYSAGLTFAILSEGDALVRRVLSVVLVQAQDFSSAHAEALRVGREAEEVYRDREGNRVRWALETVSTIDEIGELRSGREIFVEFRDLEPAEALSFETRFDPSQQVPGQTGV